MSQASITDVFTGVARAVVACQVRMDERLPYRPRHVYAIPAVEVNASFGVNQVHGKTLFFFGNAAREELKNNLRFRLLATYSPHNAAPVGPSDANLILAPPFLVPRAERDRMIAELTAELLHRNASQYGSEVQAIQEAIRTGHDGPGITFLRLSPNRTLIVRLGKHNDGIFVLDALERRSLEVYSYEGSGDERISWTPFHELFEAIRKWQSSGYRLAPLAGLTPPARFGPIEIARFVDELTRGASAAREELAGNVSGEVYPVCYSLQEVAADLSYSVPHDNKAASAFETPLIRSVARVEIGDGEGHRVSLLAPEYILTGAERAEFFKLFSQFKERDASDGSGLWSHVDPGYLADYRRALADSRWSRDAVIVLSYRGNIPTDQFLVIWTGTVGDDGEERDFAFRVELKRNRLVFVDLVLPLEDPTSPSSIFSSQRPFRLATVRCDARHSGLQDAFHASWIWDQSGDWTAPTH
jgi:hypothetical protein